MRRGRRKKKKERRTGKPLEVKQTVAKNLTCSSELDMLINPCETTLNAF